MGFKVLCLEQNAFPLFAFVLICVIFVLLVQRLLLAALFHVDEMHLCYNMASFLWKGRQLETRYGPKVNLGISALLDYDIEILRLHLDVFVCFQRFAWMLFLFAILANVLFVLVGVILGEFFHYPAAYHQCAVGFSSVLFALKVVLFHHSPNGYHR